MAARIKCAYACQVLAHPNMVQASSGMQQAETRAINLSLSAFNTCLKQLHGNQQPGATAKPVPVRESLLTRILGDMMNGYGRLVISAHFSLDPENAEATRRTLDFAQRAAEIRTAPEVQAARTVQIADAAQDAAHHAGGKRTRVCSCEMCCIVCI